MELEFRVLIEFIGGVSRIFSTLIRSWGQGVKISKNTVLSYVNSLSQNRLGMRIRSKLTERSPKLGDY